METIMFKALVGSRQRESFSRWSITEFGAMATFVATVLHDLDVQINLHGLLALLQNRGSIDYSKRSVVRLLSEPTGVEV